MKNKPYIIVVTKKIRVTAETGWHHLRGNAHPAACQYGETKLYGLKTDLDGNILEDEPIGVRDAIVGLVSTFGNNEKVICLIHRTELDETFHPKNGEMQSKLPPENVEAWIRSETVEGAKSPSALHSNIELWYFSTAGGSIRDALGNPDQGLYDKLAKVASARRAPAADVLKHQIGKIMSPVDIYLQGIMCAVNKSAIDKRQSDADMAEALKNTRQILFSGDGACGAIAKILESHRNECTDLAKSEGALAEMRKLVEEMEKHLEMESLAALKKCLCHKKVAKGSTSFHECFVKLMRELESVRWKWETV